MSLATIEMSTFDCGPGTGDDVESSVDAQKMIRLAIARLFVDGR